MRVGIDARKKSCTTCIFADGSEVEGSPVEQFVFKTTPHGVSEFIQKVPDNSLIVIETSTTGKALSLILLQKYNNIHMVSPPETKPQVKTDKSDAERIVKRTCLATSEGATSRRSTLENMHSVVMQQIDLGEKISRVKRQVHSLLEKNMVQSEFEEFSDMFGVDGLSNPSQIVYFQQGRTWLQWRCILRSSTFT
jgi:transposase